MGFALFAAECLFGLPRLRLEAAYLVKPDGSVCVIESRGAAGEAVARLVLGRAEARLGGRIAVERVQPERVTGGAAQRGAAR